MRRLAASERGYRPSQPEGRLRPERVRVYLPFVIAIVGLTGGYLFQRSTFKTIDFVLTAVTIAIVVTSVGCYELALWRSRRG